MRLPGIAFLGALVVALLWASWAAFRPIAPVAAAPPRAVVDPAAELARARGVRHAEAVDAAIAAAMLDRGVTRGDVRFETRTPAGPSGLSHAELAVDVLGATAPLAEAIAARASAVDGAVASHEARGDHERVAVSIDGVEVAALDLYPTVIPPLPDNGGRPRIAIVIDDVGYAKAPIDKLLAVSRNITFSVLPYGPMTSELADAIHKRGAEVMLHLPMEPEGTPGGLSHQGMLMHDMSSAALRMKTAEALALVPHADGVNNHMGSRLTADEGAMKAVMEELTGRKLFFLDSRTSPQTVAFRAARAAGLRALERDVFLDDVAEIGPILKQIDELEARAKKRGFAVAIGHPYPATVAAIVQAVPTLIDRGFEIVPARELAGKAPVSLTPPPASGTP